MAELDALRESMRAAYGGDGDQVWYTPDGLVTVTAADRLRVRRAEALDASVNQAVADYWRRRR